MLKLRGRTVDEVNYPISTRDIITATISNEYVTTTTGEEKVALNIVDNSVGNKLTLSNGGIKIGAGVSYVKISAGIMFSNVGANNVIHACNIYLNDTKNIETALRPVGDYLSIAISEKITNVKENDILYLYVKSTTTGGVVRNSSRFTHLTVEVVGYS